MFVCRRDLGIPKIVAGKLVGAVHMEFKPTDTFIGDVHAHYSTFIGT